jgi:hypothetical protein
MLWVLEVPPPELPPVEGNPDEEPAELEISAMDAVMEQDEEMMMESEQQQQQQQQMAASTSAMPLQPPQQQMMQQPPVVSSYGFLVSDAL